MNAWETNLIFAIFLCAVVCFQATQKGDPVAILKKQLEEKEKQLAEQQEEASTARNRIRELTKVRQEPLGSFKKQIVPTSCHKNADWSFAAMAPLWDNWIFGSMKIFANLEICLLLRC